MVASRVLCRSRQVWFRQSFEHMPTRTFIVGEGLAAALPYFSFSII